ncbi:cell division protein FtsA [Candidatus Tisiphia endosymbiont of Ptychoptera albimana]|uniref:cell division protein FtsA n=1 Tax=Candidatus Tisiphia endosymbiont of Ptychoptera albimana TaxID=3066260 RepID=UPI001E114DA6|nr:cell division protein FtsA [Rickettsia endosymbiont of Sericostoma sp. HW-2014]
MKARLSNFLTLDLGSSKIACIAAYIDKREDARIVSQVLHHSKGIKSGVILDLKDAENSIVGAIYALEKDCGKNIKKITISLTGYGTKSYYANSKIKLSNQPISPQDIKKLIKKALLEFKIKDQEIIHYFPIEFTLDNNNAIEDPIGMFGKELGCELHIITANFNMLMNITNCFAKCHVEINNIILAIYASGIACLSEDEKNLGSIIIDMGARTTSFGVFVSGKLIYTSYIDIGSFHITSDIAKVFSVSLNVAEKLKILYGNAMPSSLDKDNIINLEDFEMEIPDSGRPAITSKYLACVISPRVEEILLMVQAQHDRVVAGNMVAYRIVITGGGAMLRGVKELASKIFEKQVRIGKPEILPGFAEDYNPHIYSTAIGMVKTQSLKIQKNNFDINDASWFKKFLIWLKENI